MSKFVVNSRRDFLKLLGLGGAGAAAAIAIPKRDVAGESSKTPQGNTMQRAQGVESGEFPVMRKQTDFFAHSDLTYTSRFPVYPDPSRTIEKKETKYWRSTQSDVLTRRRKS